MPERWLDESVPEQAWLPFGTGPRQCMGIKFAMQDLKARLQSVHAPGGMGPSTGPACAW